MAPSLDPKTGKTRADQMRKPTTTRRTFRRDTPARSQTSTQTPKPKPAAKPAPKAPDKKARVTTRGGVQTRLRELKKKRDARKKANEAKNKPIPRIEVPHGVLKHGGLVKGRRKFRS